MTLSQPYEDDNVFAKILRGDIPAAVIAETDATFAFMDAFPQSEGHALVIPKTGGATNILDVETDTLKAVIAETQRVARAVHRALSPEGIRIVQFNGTAAGQSVYHIHFHIIPVWTDRPMAPHGGGMADMAMLDRLADRIKAAL